MKIGIIGSLAIAALAIAGCGKQDAASVADKPLATKAAPVDKNAVMVSVNGKKLTRGEIDADVQMILETRKGQIPPEQIEEAKKAFGEQMAQTFIMKTLLLDEAAKKGVKVTDADRKAREEEFVKANAGRPDSPKSIAEFAEHFPLGKERGLKEFEDGVLIQKLLEQEVSSKIVVDAKKVEETIQNITSNNVEMAKKALDAEAKIKGLAKQLEGLQGEALLTKFAELAKAHSDCPSKEKGGDLGEFTRGRMVKEFEDVAFDQPLNTVSKPVKTQFGWHLIMPTKKIEATAAQGDKPAEPAKVQASHILVMAREPQKVPTKEEIEKGLKRQQEGGLMRKYFEDLRNAAKIEAPGYPNLLPPPKPAPAAKPAPTSVESKPVEVKPAAKPVEVKPIEVKPTAKPAEVKPTTPAPAPTPAPASAPASAAK